MMMVVSNAHVMWNVRRQPICFVALRMMWRGWGIITYNRIMRSPTSIANHFVDWQNEMGHPSCAQHDVIDN